MLVKRKAGLRRGVMPSLSQNGLNAAMFSAEGAKFPVADRQGDIWETIHEVERIAE